MDFTIKILGIVVLVSVFVSCRDKNYQSVYDYEIYKSLDIDLDERDMGGFVFGYQIVEIDGKDMIALNIMDKGKISFYNLDDGSKVNEIIVDTVGYINGFKFINNDSIIVHCSNMGQEEEMNSPQAYRLIDYNGNVKEIYGYDIDEQELIKNNYDKKKIFPFPGGYFAYCKGNIVSPDAYSHGAGLVGTKVFFETPMPFAIRMDIREKKCHVSNIHKQQYVNEGDYYPTYVHWHVAVTPDGWPVILNPYNQNLFEWHFTDDKLITHPVKSKLFDTIKPLKMPAEYPYDVPEYFDEIWYLEQWEVYFCTVLFNKNFYGEDIWDHIILDKDFNYLGEIYDKKIWPVGNRKYTVNFKQIDEQTCKVEYIRLVKTNIDFGKYIDSCRIDLQTRRSQLEMHKCILKEGSIPTINYVKSQIDIKESTYKILTLYCNEGCIGCEQVVLYTLMENKEIINKVPLYIVVSANEPAHFDSYVRQNELSYFDKMVPDTYGIMKSLANSNFLLNPRLTIVKDGVVTLDTIYQAQDIEDKLLPQITGPDEYTKYILDENGEVIVISKM